MQIEKERTGAEDTRLKILVVDQSEADFRSVRGMLEKTKCNSYSTFWAPTYEEGLEALASHQYHAVLVTDQLGQHSGIEFIKAVKQQGDDDIPIILFANEEDNRIDLEAMQIGADQYLSKREVTPSILERTVRYTIELKQKERALRRSEERFQIASWAINGVIYDWSIGRDEVYQSDGLERVVGFKPGQEPGGSKDWWPRNIHPDDYERVQSELQTAIRSQKNTFKYEYRIRHRDGHWVHIWDQGYIVRNEKGDAQRVVGICTDITDRKQAEAKLRESERERQEIIERFRVTLAAAPISVYTTDKELRITWIYDPTPGLQTEAMLGQRMDEIIPNNTGEEVLNIQQKVLETGLARQGEIESWVDDQLFVYAYYIDPIYDIDGKINGVACAGYDITNRKLAERKILDYAGQLERSNKTLEDFASIASHDLQEPLRKIILFGERLQNKVKHLNDEEINDYLNRVNGAAVRMRTMINGLLNLSRVNVQGKSFGIVDLNRIIEEVRSDLESRLREVNGQVRFGSLPAIEADEGQIRSLFQNLISNALKFHKPDVPPIIEITATLAETSQTRAVEIRVVDNGIGFEQQYAERIFQPFQRLHGKNSEYEGTGLGLAICQKIVERHQGTINVESTPGVGATFIIELPVKRRPGNFTGHRV